jgi:hypothetical protein
MSDSRFDAVVMLLSTDWFLPFWSRVGLNVPPIEGVKVQEACRITVRHIISGAPADAQEYWLTDFTPERLAKSRTLLINGLLEREVPAGVVSAVERFLRGENPTIDGPTQWLVVRLTEQLISGESSVRLDLPAAAQQALKEAWSRCQEVDLEWDELCRQSRSSWDAYTRSLTPDLPLWLAYSASDFANQPEFGCLWEFVQTALSNEERKQLLRWYHTAAESLTDNPLRLPRE